MTRIAVGFVLALAAMWAAAQAPDAPDRPRRQLQISVRFDNAIERVDQRVQVLDGGRATILTGQSRPVRQRQYIPTPAGVVSQEVTVLQEATTGFEVSPWLAGNMVTVDIYASRSASISSTASGRLGEWFELGSVAAGGETRRVFVKVEALGD